MTTIHSICQEFNLDESAMKSLNDYISRRISQLDDEQKALLVSDAELLKQFTIKCVTSWRESSISFFQRMLNPQTEEDRQMREQLVTEVKNHHKG